MSSAESFPSMLRYIWGLKDAGVFMLGVLLIVYFQYILTPWFSDMILSSPFGVLALWLRNDNHSFSEEVYFPAETIVPL